MTITLTKRHLIIALFFILFFSFSISWYLLPSFYWLFAPATGITVITAIALWFTHREDDETKQRKAQQKADKQAVKKLFKLLLQELKAREQFKQKYRLPWYLYLSQNMQADHAVLNQMGFRHSSAVNVDKQFSVQVWLKSNAVLLALDIKSEDYRGLDNLNLLLAKVKGFRSRQALNGILLSQSIDALLRKDKASNKEMADNSRLVIDAAQKSCGQQIPLYVLFNQMANLADFGQFFASLEEHQLDGCFGALKPTSSSADFQLPWFEQSFDDLCHRMGESVAFALDKQLNESFRRSVVAAPIQFRQLKEGISHYLTELFSGKPAAHSYQFRGYFFTNTENNAAVSDPLTKQIAYQLDHHEMVISEGVKFSHSIFISELFNRFIRPEAGMAQVNKLRKRLLLSFQMSYWFLMLALLAGTAALCKSNFDYYQSLNDTSLVKLDQYKRAVKQSPYRKDDLANTVDLLNRVSSIYQSYDKTPPDYILSWIPNPSLLPSLQKAYHSELLNALLPALVNDIEVQLSAYQQSGNVLHTAELLELISALQKHKEADWLKVKGYFQQRYETDKSVAYRKLATLMDDLYQLGFTRVVIDKNLIAQAEVTVNGINQADVLYDFIKKMPKFLATVSLTQELGNNFNQLFQLKDQSLLSVPFIYTPQGFSALDLNVNSQLMKMVLAENKALLGDDINEYQVNNLVIQLQRLYQREYIAFWKAFIANLSLKPVTNENLFNSLNLLVTKTDSPLAQLFDALSYYTKPKLQALISEVAEANSALKKAADKDKLLTPKKQAYVVSTEQRMMVKEISDEFLIYQSFTQADEKGVSQLTNFVSHLSAVKKWLDKSNQSDDIKGEYFQQLIAPETDQSLYLLNEVTVSIEPLEAYKQGMIALINNNIRQSVTNYLEQQWQQQISLPFATLFGDKFPFSTTSESDVSLKEFNRYFKVDGIFNQQSEALLAKFKRVDGRLLLSGFLPKNSIVVSETVIKQLAHLTQIQRVLYPVGKSQLAIPFKLNIKNMSAQLLKFELFSQRTLMTYQHGPKLWRDFIWPDLATQGELLTIFTDTQGQKNTVSYDGDWAWLRLIYQNYQSNQDQMEIKIGQEQKEVTLHIAVESDVDPLDPLFFSQLKFPTQLLQD